MTRAVPRRVPRAPWSRPDTSATGRPERPDPCADPPTVTIDPTRTLPAVPEPDPSDDADTSKVAAVVAAVPAQAVSPSPGTASPAVSPAVSPDPSPALSPTVSPTDATVPRLRSVTPAGSGALGDGRVLAVGSAVGVLGSLVAWLVAARTLPAADVGRAVAVVAVVAVAACVARPDRGAALVDRLPAAGRRAGHVVVRSLAAAVALGAAAGLALALVVPGPAATLAGPGAPLWTGVLLVAVAAAAWAVGSVHDGVAVGLDRPWWATAHVAVVAAARIALLAAAAALPWAGDRGAGADWPATAWLLPVLVWALPGSVAVTVLARRHGRRSAASPPQVLGPTAVARLGATLLHHLVPLAVVLGAGPGAGAVFFVAWQVVTAADLAAVWVLGRPGGAGRRRLLLTVGPALAVLAVAAGPLLGVFGPDYAAAADVLRVLLVGALFRLVVVHELGAREAAGRAWSSARLHLGTTVPTLLAVAATVAAVALTGGTAPAAGSAVAAGDGATVLLPVAAAYALVQVACAGAVLVSLPARRRDRPEVQQ